MSQSPRTTTTTNNPSPTTSSPVSLPQPSSSSSTSPSTSTSTLTPPTPHDHQIITSALALLSFNYSPAILSGLTPASQSVQDAFISYRSTYHPSERESILCPIEFVAFLEVLGLIPPLTRGLPAAPVEGGGVDVDVEVGGVGGQESRGRDEGFGMADLRGELDVVARDIGGSGRARSASPERRNDGGYRSRSPPRVESGDDDGVDDGSGRKGSMTLAFRSRR